MFQDSSYNFIKNSSGYTLLEILVSLVIFATVAVSLSSPFYQSISLTANDQTNIEVNNLARLYFRDLGQFWSTQNSFDSAQVITTSTPGYTYSTYTANSKYTLPAPNLDSNWGNYDVYNGTSTSAICIVRRVHIYFKDQNGNTVAGFYQDFTRPTS